METDNNDSNNTEKVGKIEQVEMSISNGRKRRDEYEEHDEGCRTPGEDQRSSPNAQTGGITGPGLAIQIGGI